MLPSTYPRGSPSPLFGSPQGGPPRPPHPEESHPHYSLLLYPDLHVPFIPLAPLDMAPFAYLFVYRLLGWSIRSMRAGSCSPHVSPVPRTLPGTEKFLNQ